MTKRTSLRAVLTTGLVLSGACLATTASAGTAINQATTGTPGSAIVISNNAPTQILKANGVRYGWTIYCSGTAGAIAILVEPGDSQGDAAGAAPNTVAPSQTLGFPIPANSLITDEDFPVRGLDALHQRLDAEAQGSSPVSCYTWEEQ